MSSEPTIPGVSAKTLYERVTAEFERLGGPALPAAPSQFSTDDFARKWRERGGERSDILTQSWNTAKNSVLEEMHLMLRFLCRPHMNAVPRHLNVRFLLSILEAPEPDDSQIQMKSLDGTHSLWLMSLSDLKALVRFAIVNLPEPVEIPPEIDTVAAAAKETYERLAQLVAEQARRDAFAEMRIAARAAHPDDFLRFQSLSATLALIDEVSQRPYVFTGVIDAAQGRDGAVEQAPV
jgi:hypothetical protein